MNAARAVAVRSAFIHAGSAHDAGIDREDIRHRHESRDARHDFCPDGRVIFLQVKNSVQNRIAVP